MLICESQASHSLNYSWPHSLLMTSSSHLQLHHLLLTFSIHFQLSQSHFWLFNLLSLFKNCNENLQKNPRSWLVLTDLQWWVFEAWRLSFLTLIIENDQCQIMSSRGTVLIEKKFLYYWAMGCSNKRQSLYKKILNNK